MIAPELFQPFKPGAAALAAPHPTPREVRHNAVLEQRQIPDSAN
ncbi:hypothetical protein CBM2597_P170014 [Cupriavidus taiwanensis]|nr:hypothetical protein CBM2597_P170014 [Cupriavidus taiwanensis]